MGQAGASVGWRVGGAGRNEAGESSKDREAPLVTQRNLYWLLSSQGAFGMSAGECCDDICVFARPLCNNGENKAGQK